MPVGEKNCIQSFQRCSLALILPKVIISCSLSGHGFLAAECRLVSNHRIQGRKPLCRSWEIKCPFLTISSCVSSCNINPFLQLMSFSPTGVTFTHHFSCLCWTLRLWVVDIAMTAVIKTQGTKFLYFCRFNLQVQVKANSPKSGCLEGCLQEPLAGFEFLRQCSFIISGLGQIL